MADPFDLILFKNRTFADVTFGFDGKVVKVHQCVLAARCDYFKRLFDRTKGNLFYFIGVPFVMFNEIINYCYLQTIDIKYWSYSDKRKLLKTATKINYKSLADFVERRLEKPAVPLSVKSLKEWHENRPEDEIREWVENNLLNIVNYEDCQKYSKDLIVFIGNTYYEMLVKEVDKYKLETKRKVPLWLFRWQESRKCKDEDVRNLFRKISFDILLNVASSSKKPLPLKQFEEVVRFCRFRKVKMTGWTLDEVLELLRLAHAYQLGPLLDTVANVVGTQYLNSDSFSKIHNVASKFQSRKLKKLMVDYANSNALRIDSIANYLEPYKIRSFIFTDMMVHPMNRERKIQTLDFSSPMVPLSVKSLNEWYEKSSFEEMRGWIKDNMLDILRNESCKNYSKQLVIFIMDTFYKMYDSLDDKGKLESARQRLLMWPLCWKNSSNRKVEDVISVFEKVRWKLVPQKQLLNMSVAFTGETTPKEWLESSSEHPMFRGTQRRHE